MNTRLILVAAALTLTACTGGEPTAVQTHAPAPPRAAGEPNVVYTIYQWLSPEGSFVPSDTTIEYGIRFKSSMPGRVVGLRLYTFQPKTYRVRVRYDNSGILVSPVTIVGDSVPGWRRVQLGTPKSLIANAYYRVSVSTTLPNGQVGMIADFFTGGPFTNNILTATNGFIRQAGQFYDGTTAYLVDVEFQPDPE